MRMRKQMIGIALGILSAGCVSMSVQAEEFNEEVAAQMEENMDISDELDAIGNIAIDSTNFPDSTFKNYIVNNIDKDGDRILSASEISETKSIDISNKYISSLKGIELFTSLTELICDRNNLKALDISKNIHLEKLVCYQNEIESLDVKNNTALTHLDFCSNQICEIDLSSNTGLTYLDCGANPLESIDIKNNTSLVKLECIRSQFAELDIRNNTMLEYLDCCEGVMTTLDISANQKLNYLDCHRNQLKSIDISKNGMLSYLDCSQNSLADIDLSNNNLLEHFDCAYNNIKELDVVSNTNLSFLDISHNYLKTIDVSNNTRLTEFACGGNYFKGIDISKNIGLEKLDCSECLDMEQIDVSNNTALKTLYCNNVWELSDIDVSNNTQLVEFSCSGNKKITNIDVSHNPALESFSCSWNSLAELDVTNNKKLKVLGCISNQIKCLDLSNNPDLVTLRAESNLLIGLNTDNNPNLTTFIAFSDFGFRGNKIDTTQWDRNFDSSRMTDINNLSVENGVITILDIDESASYKYQCGNGNTMSVRLGSMFPFDDVTQVKGNWKYEAVKYVYKNGIMNGITGTYLFKPDDQLNRAMFATVLYRMAGSPVVEFSNKFTDVEEGKYYSNAVIWANQQGIVSGFTDGSYGVNTNITREQIAKMLYLYGQTQGYDVSGAASLDDFTDTESVSGWATGYMQWAVDAGMISGKPNGDDTFRLDPKGQATRAECAKMLMMFEEKYK